jgi:hypothetical protein
MRQTCGNLLLDSLPLATVEVGAGEEVVTRAERGTYAFFPASAVCSLTMVLKSGDKAECASVVSLIATPPRSAFAATGQVAGLTYRLPLGSLGELLQRHCALREAVLVYTGFALNVVGRSPACNSYHSIAKRLARWLLVLHDRVDGDELALTHDMLSQVLAATRPRVSLAAAKLRSLRAIDYQRGVVRIVDRQRLEQAACECDESARRYQQLLPWLPR